MCFEGSLGKPGAGAWPAACWRLGGWQWAVIPQTGRSLSDEDQSWEHWMRLFLSMRDGVSYASAGMDLSRLSSAVVSHYILFDVRVLLFPTPWTTGPQTIGSGGARILVEYPRTQGPSFGYWNLCMSDCLQFQTLLELQLHVRRRKRNAFPSFSVFSRCTHSHSVSS